MKLINNPRQAWFEENDGLLDEIEEVAEAVLRVIQKDLEQAHGPAFEDAVKRLRWKTNEAATLADLLGSVPSRMDLKERGVA